MRGIGSDSANRLVRRAVVALGVSAVLTSTLGTVALPAHAASVNGVISTSLPNGLDQPLDLGGLPIFASNQPSAPFTVDLTNTIADPLPISIPQVWAASDHEGLWELASPVNTCGLAVVPATHTLDGTIPPNTTCTVALQARETAVGVVPSFGILLPALDVNVTDPLHADQLNLAVSLTFDDFGDGVFVPDSVLPTLNPGLVNTRTITWHGVDDGSGTAYFGGYSVSTGTVDPSSTCPNPNGPVSAVIGTSDVTCTVVVSVAPSDLGAGSVPIKQLSSIDLLTAPPLSTALQWRVPTGVVYSTAPIMPTSAGGNDVVVPAGAGTTAFFEIPVTATSAATNVSASLTGGNVASSPGGLGFELTTAGSLTFNACPESDPSHATCGDLDPTGQTGDKHLSVGLSVTTPTSGEITTAVTLTATDTATAAITTSVVTVRVFILYARWKDATTAPAGSATITGTLLPTDPATVNTGGSCGSGNCAFVLWQATFDGPVEWAADAPDSAGIFDVGIYQYPDLNSPPCANCTPYFVPPAGTVRAGREVVHTGTVYMVQLRGLQANQAFSVRLATSVLADPSDNFANASDLKWALPYLDARKMGIANYVDTWNATPEAIDPVPGTNSVWAKLTPDVTAPLTVTTWSNDSGPAALPTIYTQDALGNLTQVPTGVPGLLGLPFNSVAGTTYYFLVSAQQFFGELVIYPVLLTAGTPPILTLPASPFTVEALAGANSAIVDFPATAVSGVTSAPITPVSCTPASGSVFPIGDSTVTCTATDTAQNASTTATFIVHVNFVPLPVTNPGVPGLTVVPGSASGSLNVTVTATGDGNAAPLICSVTSDFAPPASIPACTFVNGAARLTITNVPLGTPGTVTATVENSAGLGATSGPIVVSPLVPPGASNATTAASTTPAGTASAVSAVGSVTTTATATGVGSVTTAQYAPGAPVPAAATPFAQAATNPFDVVVSAGNSFSSVDISSCPAGTNQTLWWFNATSSKWEQTTPSASVINGCLTFTATNSSSPNIFQLTGTVFAVAEAPASGLVSAATSKLPVNGSTTVSATVLGSASQPLPSTEVTLQPGGATGLTDASGVATFTVTSATAGAVTYTATAGSLTLGTATVTYGTGPAVTSGAPGDATTGQPFSFTLVADSGTWSATGLPAWLSLSANGGLSGTPTTAGSYSFTATVTNAFGHTDVPVTVTVYDPLTVAGGALANPTAGVPYSFTISGGGGKAPLAWSATGLPSGLSINPTTGQISGTTTVVGPYSATVTLSDARNQSASATTTLNVAASSPASGTVSANPTLVILPGNSTLTVSVVDAYGNPVPNATVSTTGALTTTNSSGVATLTVTSATAAAVTYTVTAGTATIGTATVAYGNPPVFTAAAPGDGVTGSAYSYAFVASGSPVFSASGLPAWASLTSGGVLTGTPPTPGAYTFTMTATNAFGTVNASVKVSVYDPLVITTTSLPAATAGVAYAAPISGSGGKAPLAWSATGLPGGLTISPTTGAITGTATVAGSSLVKVTLTDARSQTASFTASLVVNPGAPASATVTATPATVTLPGTSTLAIMVFDGYNNPTPGVSISVNGTALTTDVAGKATTTVTATVAGPVTYTVTAGATTLGSVTVTYQTAPPPTGADIGVGLTVDNFANNTTAQFHARVTNTSTVSAPGPITVTFTLPAGLTYSGANGTGWKCTATGQVVLCTNASALGVKRSTTVNVNARVRSTVGASLTTTATAAFAGTDPTPADNTATLTARVRRP